MSPRIVVFGAFDRHNLGDLLFAHVAEAMLGGHECVFAGLVDRDLRAWGGHRVHALADIVRETRNDPAAPDTLLHAGGEILTCDAWQAAVMLLEPREAARIVARLDANPAGRDAWAREVLGRALRTPAADVPRAPYVVSHASMPGIARVAFAAVGGVDLSACDAALRTEVLQALRCADPVSVRDDVTRTQLRASGIEARLVPDPAVMVDELFGDRIRARSTSSPELARVRDAFPDGWIAVQFSADFGDDATVAEIAAQLDGFGRDTGQAFVLFRAGAAPWHDSLDVLERIAARMHAPARVFESIDVWDVCALIACSRGFCGSSLHGRIVAGAFGVARVNVVHPSSQADRTKQHAWASTWEGEAPRSVVRVHEIDAALRAATSVDRAVDARRVRTLAARYRTYVDGMRGWLSAA